MDLIKLDKQNMKKLLLGMIFVLTSILSFSQVTTIYTEDFSNDWKKGAITYGGVTPAQPTDGNWSWVNVGSPTNDGGSATSWNDMAFMDGAAVMSTNGATSSTLAFRWNDVNNGSTSNRVDWYSKSITGAYTTITASLTYAIGNGSSANSVWAYYQIDGGSWTLFGSSVNQSTASGTFTSSSLSCSSSIQIKVEALTRNNNSAYVTIDNVQITACPVVVPAVSVATGSNNICSGTSVTFTATPTNGGTTPSYQWKNNGVNVGTNSDTYTNNSLANGDVITCVMTSNASCASPTTATSNSTTMSVSQISVGGTVAADQNVTSGGNAADINLSGHTGSVVKWQRDVVSTFATATDIANTTTSVTGTSMGAITQTIYYRAVVQNGTCPSINSAYVTITVVSGLPIELLYFSGVEYGSVNNLYWSTASEDNNDYFNIEKSTDGEVWTVICKLKGAGNSINKLNYSFLDDNVERTVNYYKLKQTDYDGKFKYSEIISIDNRNISKSKMIDKTTNILGQEVNIEYYRGLVIIYYTDGSSEKIIK